MKNLLFNSVLQNLASNSLKSFGVYEETILNLKMCLLDYRKLFSMDKTKVQAAQNRINRALARANLPRIEDDAKMTPEEAKLESSEAKSSSQGAIDNNSFSVPAKPGSRAPSGRIRKQISDASSSSSETESASSSSVEYPVEGRHTDTEEDSDGTSTPIFIQTVPPPTVEAQPKSSSLPIPKKSKKSKRSRKAKKSSRKSNKSQPKKSRVSGKKNRKEACFPIILVTSRQWL